MEICLRFLEKKRIVLHTSLLCFTNIYLSWSICNFGITNAIMFIPTWNTTEFTLQHGSNHQVTILGSKIKLSVILLSWWSPGECKAACALECWYCDIMCGNKLYFSPFMLIWLTREIAYHHWKTFNNNLVKLLKCSKLSVFFLFYFNIQRLLLNQWCCPYL